MTAKMSNVTPWPKDVMKKYRWLDEYLQKQPATEREFRSTWQAYRYLIGGKMYAYIGIDDRNGRPIITLKLEPAANDRLRREYANIVPGYYMNKINWSTVYLDGDVPQTILIDIVDIAHQLVFSSLSKKAQREILGK